MAEMAYYNIFYMGLSRGMKQKVASRVYIGRGYSVEGYYT